MGEGIKALFFGFLDAHSVIVVVVVHTLLAIVLVVIQQTLTTYFLQTLRLVVEDVNHVISLAANTELLFIELNAVGIRQDVSIFQWSTIRLNLSVHSLLDTVSTDVFDCDGHVLALVELVVTLASSQIGVVALGTLFAGVLRFVLNAALN